MGTWIERAETKYMYTNQIMKIREDINDGVIDGIKIKNASSTFLLI